jgi:hypothetical protein
MWVKLFLAEQINALVGDFGRRGFNDFLMVVRGNQCSFPANQAAAGDLAIEHGLRQETRRRQYYRLLMYLVRLNCTVVQV